MQFDVVYGELTQSTEVIRSLLKGIITQESASIKPNPAEWSMLEMTCHLYDEEREDFREHLDFILHRQKEEWHPIDPESWVTDRKYNEQNFEEMQAKFFDERGKSLEWLNSISNANWDMSYTSPFGTMSAGEMFASWVAHDNLHIRQLVELRRARIEIITKPYNIFYAGDW